MMNQVFLFLLACLLWASPLFAVEKISTLTDGSVVFRCEYKGKDYKVRVKYMGNGVYRVLRSDQGTVAFSGETKAVNYGEAAAVGCGKPQ